MAIMRIVKHCNPCTTLRWYRHLALIPAEILLLHPSKQSLQESLSPFLVIKASPHLIDAADTHKMHLLLYARESQKVTSNGVPFRALNAVSTLVQIILPIAPVTSLPLMLRVPLQTHMPGFSPSHCTLQFMRSVEIWRWSWCTDCKRSPLMCGRSWQNSGSASLLSSSMWTACKLLWAGRLQLPGWMSMQSGEELRLQPSWIQAASFSDHRWLVKPSFLSCLPLFLHTCIQIFGVTDVLMEE